jgi:DNA-binding transcriptional ArsR family regulator
MVKERELNDVFSALAHPTRRAMLARLAAGNKSVGELAEPFKLSAPAITKHLHVLEEAGLVRRSVDGRIHILQLEAEPLRGAANWIQPYARFWHGQFDALEDFLRKSNKSRDKR